MHHFLQFSQACTFIVFVRTLPTEANNTGPVKVMSLLATSTWHVSDSAEHLLQKQYMYCAM